MDNKHADNYIDGDSFPTGQNASFLTKIIFLPKYPHI